ncbi:PEP-CTERM sorting domain-containing protein [bacterium]|nr:PEP-CTERM sorting domain-containing protein [bacterium]
MRNRTRLAWALTVALGAAGPAGAFYWDGWPGSSLPAPRSLVPPADSPKSPPNPNAEPKFPPGNEPPRDTPGGPGPVPNPEPVPEPASAIAVLAGLGALAARRLRRK